MIGFIKVAKSLPLEFLKLWKGFISYRDIIAINLLELLYLRIMSVDLNFYLLLYSYIYPIVKTEAAFSVPALSLPVCFSITRIFLKEGLNHGSGPAGRFFTFNSILIFNSLQWNESARK